MDQQQYKVPPLLDVPKIPSLDGLRAVSIALVISFHSVYNFKNENNSAMGKMGVEIFFVISGFLITTLLLKEKIRMNKISLKKFYIRRAFRILPVVFLFLSVLFILNQVFELHITNLSFITALSFVKNLPIPNGGDWYTGHFWSLAIEEQYYLIFPCLIAYLSIKTYKRLIMVLIPFLTVVNFCFYHEIGLFYSNKIVHIISLIIANLFSGGTISILVGSFLSVWVFENPGILNRFFSKQRFFHSFILFLIALVIRLPLFHLYISNISEVLFAFAIGVVIIMNLTGNNLMARVLNQGFMIKIGILSYSLYIWQQIFTCNQPWGNTFRYGNSIILNLSILFLVAYLSYQFYEKKFLDLKARFKNVN